MSSERLDRAKTIAVGMLMLVAFLVLGHQGAQEEIATPTLALVDHSPATGSEYLTQLISE